jgi:hypothetical protein
MRRLLRTMAYPILILTGPIRRRAGRRIDHLVRMAVWDVLQPHLAEIGASLNRIESTSARVSGVEQSINIARCNADAAAADTNLVLDSVVRELARLQMQVDDLREAIEQRNGLSLVTDAERDVA